MPESFVSRFRRWSRPTGMHLLIAGLIGVLGFAMTTQFGQDDATDYTSVRGVELVELLKSIDAANERLGTQIDDLTQTRDELLSSTRRSEDAEEQARKRSEQLAILAGSAGATGPGVAVTIDDPDEAVSANQLLDAVQELRDAGAEAIAINGTARVVAQTYFLDDERAVVVGGREVQAALRHRGDRRSGHHVGGGALPRRADRPCLERGRKGHRGRARQGHHHGAGRRQGPRVRSSHILTGIRSVLTRKEHVVIPEDLYYSEEHEWVRLDDDVAIIGITDYAQEQLGDIVYVDLPQVGEKVESGTVIGELESTKSVSDVFSPLSGEVMARNETLDGGAEVINSDPYGEGWLIKVRTPDADEVESLLSPEAYGALVSE